MLSRRSFLSMTGAAAGLSVTRVSAQRGRAAAPAGPLPPSIAALTSMRDRAVPISNDERRARIEKARRLMAEHRLDAILLTGGTSLVYFTGLRWGTSERLLAILIPRTGNPYVVCPAFEEDRAREQLALGPLAHTDVATWQEDESPFERVAQGLKDRGVAAGRLGIEETTKFVFADSIASAAPALKITSATPVTAGCRMFKDSHEVGLMRLACEATLKCYEAVFKALQPGMTQDQVGALLTAGFGRLGFPGGASVQVGEYTALPHGSLTPQTIREGTIIMMDNGCTAEGYQSDITRTFVLGKATDKMKKVFDIVHQAQTAALKAARPGIAPEDIDAAGRKVIVDAGYGPGFKYFTHRLGHGMGMDGHEWPYLVKNNMYGWEKALTLQPGMVFSDEPGIYIKGEFGVRLEDDMHITPDGAELFTPQSPSIEEPFAT
jgi:Xaa-Pro aminopeptidase